ncbi:hypothetical protein [Flavobacterium sp.]|uniref:hypothetical protein n=1 Tax=Flavobacterium sp. TaxID=239 RepID=UPI00286DF036|nr:hypothetical protein [Flavobacterium sp.]
MKNTIVKIGLTIVCLFSNLLLFADPGDESDTGDLEGGDAFPGAPIGDYIWVLALIVVVYAFWKLKAAQNSRIQD